MEKRPADGCRRNTNLQETTSELKTGASITVGAEDNAASPFNTSVMGTSRSGEMMVFTLCGHPWVQTQMLYEHPPPPFYPQIIHFWWAAPLPWKWSKHPKSDAPVTTKYLIIATSFSGRRCLHLCVSLSVYDLEMKDWQRGRLHTCVGEGDQVVSGRSYISVLNNHILKLADRSPCWLLLVFIDQSLHEIMKVPPDHPPLLDLIGLRTLQFDCDFFLSIYKRNMGLTYRGKPHQWREDMWRTQRQRKNMIR